MDDYEAEYHLTPDGWIPGSYYFFGRQLGIASGRPAGTVETWIRHVNDRSLSSEECMFWSRSWKDDRYSDQDLRGLRNGIGLPLYDSDFLNRDFRTCSLLLEATESLPGEPLMPDRRTDRPRDPEPVVQASRPGAY